MKFSNPRITPKERGLLKGSIRRVFARSELRLKVLSRVTIEHSDPNRPRVKKWGYCETCGVVTPKYLLAVDHVIPVIAVDSTFEDQGADATINRTWCEEINLAAICDTCHNHKTALERAERKRLKNGNTMGK